MVRSWHAFSKLVIADRCDLSEMVEQYSRLDLQEIPIESLSSEEQENCDHETVPEYPKFDGRSSPILCFQYLNLQLDHITDMCAGFESLLYHLNISSPLNHAKT